MKKIIYAAIVCFLYGCSEQAEKQQKMVVEGLAQGTTYRIIYGSDEGIDYQRAIDSTLIEIDNSLSTYQKKSLISRFNQADSTIEVNEMFAAVFQLSKKIFQLSDGAFDPTVAPVVNAWGFGFENIHSTDSATIDSLKRLVDFSKVTMQQNQVMKAQKGMMLDFNAIAQGYSVDVLTQLLENKGVNDYLVEIGGELKAKGHNTNGKLWRVGIDKPMENLKKRSLQAIVNLDNKALATSGNYRKFYEKEGQRFSHTINPKTAYPVEHNLLSATVVTNNCAEADAWATVFMVVGLEHAKKIIADNKHLEALLIYNNENGDLQTYTTAGLSHLVELNL